MEALNWVMQQQRAPLVLQRRRVLKPQLDFRTAASRGLADFESARGDGGRPRGERGLDAAMEPAQLILAPPVGSLESNSGAGHPILEPGRLISWSGPGRKGWLPGPPVFIVKSSPAGVLLIGNNSRSGEPDDRLQNCARLQN